MLTEAAINGKVDRLLGLKENVIIGKLIPAHYLSEEDVLELSGGKQDEVFPGLTGAEEGAEPPGLTTEGEGTAALQETPCSTEAPEAASDVITPEEPEEEQESTEEKLESTMEEAKDEEEREETMGGEVT